MAAVTAMARRRWSRPVIAVDAALTALVVAMTWPLATVLNTHLVGGWFIHIDTYLTVWIVAWGARTVMTAPLHLFDGNIFHPVPHALAYSEHLLGALPVTLPIYWATENPILTHQVLLLATFVLSAFAMAALVRFWTRSDVGGFVAGALFAFARWRLAHLYWIQELLTFYAPLVVLFSSRYLLDGRRRDLVGAGACFLGQLLSSYALAYPICAALALFWPVHALAVRAPRSRIAALLAVASLAGVVFVVVSMPVARVQHLGVASLQQGGFFKVPAKRWDLRGMQMWWNPLSYLFPGYVPYTLATAGLGILVHEGATRRWPVHGRALAMSLAAFMTPLLILALGPTGGPALSWLWLHVPGLGHYRVPERFAYFVSLPIAVLAGVVAATIEQHARRAGRAWLAWPCSLLVVGVSCWESRIAPVALLPAPPVPPVYSWLARRKGPILEIPMDHVGPGGIRLADSRYVYLSTWHHQPIVNGYSGYAPAAYPLVLGLGAELPGNEPLTTLSRLTGARWLLVHLWNLTPAERSPWEARGAPLPAVRFGQDVVFAIPPPAENWQANYQQPPAGMTLAGTPVAILGDADAADLRMSDPHLVGAGTTTPVTVEVRNAGVQTWPALTVDADRRVMLALRWDVAGTAPTPAIRSGPEFPLPRDLKPGEAMTMRVVVGAPSIRGAYDLVAEIRQDVQALPTGPGRHDTRVRVEIS